MIRVIVILFFVTASFAAKGQNFDNAVHIGWNMMVPLADKEYIGSTSVAGVRLGYSKFLNERFALGFEAGYSTLDEYIPTKTYVYDGGATTTDRYNYLYYITIMANGQYHFAAGKHFMPYTSLGMGIAISQYKIFYNVYKDGDNNTGFALRPEIGTLIRIKEYSSFGFKTAVGFDYAVNGNDYLGTENLAAFNFQLGIVFMNR